MSTMEKMAVLMEHKTEQPRDNNDNIARVGDRQKDALRHGLSAWRVGFALAKGFVESSPSTFLGGDKIAFVRTVSCRANGLFVCLSYYLVDRTHIQHIYYFQHHGSNCGFDRRCLPNKPIYTFMIPVTIWHAVVPFALPIATPPNTVIFSTGRLPLVEMNKAGIFLHAVCSVILLGAAISNIPAVTGVGATDLPSWDQTFRI